MPFVCRHCGREVSDAEYMALGYCPKSGGCGNKDLRPANQFDFARAHVLAELLEAMRQNILALQVEVDALKGAKASADRAAHVAACLANGIIPD